MEDLNLLGMFADAGPMVKFVMLLLLSFSIGSWYIVFMKFFHYRKAKQNSAEFLENFWQCKNLSEAYKQSQQNEFSPEAGLFKAGYTELQKISKSKVQTSTTPQDTLEMRLAGMDNLKRSLERAESTELDKLGKALSFLATTGSATPFIGLFGTVWGIMTSFQDIGRRGSASLAIVAPGISEALVATAAGLAVAIPAVIFYNHFNHKLTCFENDMDRFSIDFLNLVERDIIVRK